MSTQAPQTPQDVNAPVSVDLIGVFSVIGLIIGLISELNICNQPNWIKIISYFIILSYPLIFILNIEKIKPDFVKAIDNKWIWAYIVFTICLICIFSAQSQCIAKSATVNPILTIPNEHLVITKTVTPVITSTPTMINKVTATPIALVASGNDIYQASENFINESVKIININEYFFENDSFSFTYGDRYLYKIDSLNKSIEFAIKPTKSLVIINHDGEIKVSRPRSLNNISFINKNISQIYILFGAGQMCDMQKNQDMASFNLQFGMDGDRVLKFTLSSNNLRNWFDCPGKDHPNNRIDESNIATGVSYHEGIYTIDADEPERYRRMDLLSIEVPDVLQKQPFYGMSIKSEFTRSDTFLTIYAMTAIQTQE